jgi:hypothetical protein
MIQKLICEKSDILHLVGDEDQINKWLFPLKSGIRFKNRLFYRQVYLISKDLVGV